MALLIELHPILFYAFAFLLTLCIGSFLNVVIYRLPIMLFKSYQEDYQSFSEQIENMKLPSGTFNLSVPASHCPHCKAPIKAYANIPLISFIIQRGKCRHCAARISVRYPLVECMTALFSILTLVILGPNLVGAVSLLFVWSLIAMTFIDFDTQILPDNLTLPLLWLGLLFNLGHFFVPLTDAVIGAMAGYLILFVVYHAFKLATGKDGMGQGDFKLLAAMGAWLGWQQLIVIIIISALLGTLVGVSLIVMKKVQRDQPLPFGPFLAIGGLSSLWFGQTLMDAYLKFIYA